MTREEEIRNKAVNEQRVLMESMDWRGGFISGAKWADKTMLEKAINWLEDIDFDMNYWNSEEGFCKTKFINDFRKALEE